jgi:hypothetical protein
MREVLVLGSTVRDPLSYRDRPAFFFLRVGR